MPSACGNAMKRLLIWGASDQAVVTLDCAQAMQMYGQIDLMGITTQKIRRFAQHRVMMEENVIHAKLFHAYDEVIVATGDNRLRQIRLQILEEYGIPIATIIHPSAIISPTAQVNCGSTILANAVIHTLAHIGTGCIINTGAIVEHDCVVKDFVNMSPNCAMAGIAAWKAEHSSVSEAPCLPVSLLARMQSSERVLSYLRIYQHMRRLSEFRRKSLSRGTDNSS